MSQTDITLSYRPRAVRRLSQAAQQRWACIVAHRRAGKTVACVMDLIHAALRSNKPDARFGYIGTDLCQGERFGSDT